MWPILNQDAEKLFKVKHAKALVKMKQKRRTFVPVLGSNKCVFRPSITPSSRVLSILCDRLRGYCRSGQRLVS